MGLVDARLDLVVRALGATAQPFQAQCARGFPTRPDASAVRVKIIFLGFQKLAVISGNSQIAVFVRTAELDHRVRPHFPGNSGSWLTTTHANSAYSSTDSSHSMPSRSRWLVGSSNSKMSGSCTSAAAMSRRCASLPKAIGDGFVIFKSRPAKNLRKSSSAFVFWNVALREKLFR